MMHEADRRQAGPPPAPAALPPDGLLLRGSHGTCRVRAWPSAPFTAQLVLYQQSRPPTVDDLRRWADHLTQRGFTSVRTSALATTASQRAADAGFHVVQTLVLLEHDAPHSAPSPPLRTSRLLVGQHSAAGAIDLAAFGDEWSLDPMALADVRRATPRHRARSAADTEGTMAAFAITGRDSRQGFLQRLAVHPAQQRQGLGSALVLDSLRWLARWRVQRVLVNTPASNDTALALYEGLGFHRLSEALSVFERKLA